MRARTECPARGADPSTDRVLRARALLLPLAALLLAAAPAAADEAEDWGRSGFYVGVSGIYTHNLFDKHVDDALSDFVGAPINLQIDDSWGVNARVGYRATSFLAFEAQYEYVNEFEVKAGTPIGHLKLNIEGHAVTGNVKFIVPTWRIQPYVLSGVGLSIYDSDVAPPFNTILDSNDESGFAARVGSGIDVYLSPHLVLNAETSVLLTTQNFKQPDVGSIDDLHYVSMGLGLQYRF